MKETFDRSGNCSLCEIRSKDILISETPNFSAIVPFAASYPFEIWIIPRQHISYFHKIDQDKVRSVLESTRCFSFYRPIVV
jgi:UDPglucose--hexose-1-phosphate uridylyltransferase